VVQYQNNIKYRCSGNYMMDNYFNLDAEKAGITPEYFNMENLRKVFSGR